MVFLSGYMSPEYAMDGVFSVKSDIYSFGVMVLEIITGKRNRGFYEVELDLNLLRYVSSTVTCTSAKTYNNDLFSPLNCFSDHLDHCSGMDAVEGRPER